MSDFQLLLGDKGKAYREFYRYRLSAFYYLSVLVLVIFLIYNFLSYKPGEEASSSHGYRTNKDNDIPTTTTENTQSDPYDYLNLPPCDLSKDSKNPAFNLGEILTEFQRCANMILLRFVRNPFGLLFNWPFTVYVCDEEEPLMKIPLKSLDNGDKQYWTLLPRCQEDTTLVTLGIGENTKAEEHLRTMVKNMTTFGTNPFLKQSKFYDKFFHVALSNNETTLQMNKTDTEDVTLYNVTTIDQWEFFNETVGVKKIDMLWINPEAGNFEYWNYLNVTGQFDQMGITVCQLNIEVTKDSELQWKQMIDQLMKGKRYIFMRPMSAQGGTLTRTFFLNVKDPECVRKYLQ